MAGNFSVVFRGQRFDLSVASPSQTLAELGRQLEEVTGAKYETLKLVLPGRKLGRRHLVPAASPELALNEAGRWNRWRCVLRGGGTD